MRGATSSSSGASVTITISIHAPHARSDFPVAAGIGIADISIHAPHARSDVEHIPDATLCEISIHAPHARSDEQKAYRRASDATFQSTLLMRGATPRWPAATSPDAISIHAPHARSDAREVIACAVDVDISIHAPHARSDSLRRYFANTLSKFQSTLLMRGATKCQMTICQHLINFNPHSSCEERRRVLSHRIGKRHFNPRSSCEERR